MNVLSIAGQAMVKGFEEAGTAIVSSDSFLDKAKALAGSHPVATGAVGALAAVGTCYAGYRLIKKLGAPSAEKTPQ